MRIGYDVYSANTPKTLTPKTESQEPQQSIDLTTPSLEILDSLEISEEGTNKANSFKDELNKMQSDVDELKRQLEAARQQGEGIANEMKIRLKCMLIAMRILKGDEVPKEDHAFLAENDIGLYGKAMSMRMEKDHPEKHKRISEDEEPSVVDDADNAPGTDAVQPSDGEITVESGGEVNSAEVSADT